MNFLCSERLYYRQANHEDAEFILALLNDPDWIANIGDRKVYDLSAAVDFIDNKINTSFTLHGHGHYVVCLRSNHIPIGLCGLLKRDFLPEVDLGYALLPAYRGKGYASEAAQFMLQLAQNTLGKKRVFAFIDCRNSASRILLTRLGFVNAPKLAKQFLSEEHMTLYQYPKQPPSQSPKAAALA